MPYRNIFIANESSLRLKNNQLIVNNGQEFSFPVEDIRSIVIDNPNSSFSVRLMSYLGEQGVCVIMCDKTHTPCCQLMPIGIYCRALKRIELQQSQTKPKLKRMWQQVVTKKIVNQAECLKLNGISSEQLVSISKTVQSGDSTNREGYAANVYFKSLFGKDFTKDKALNSNAALNYGYAIIRSFISKTLVSYGLEPSLGIHHKNQLNAFNLSDDLIEPYRPFVDLLVSKHLDLSEDFSTYHKAELQRLLNCVCTVDGQKWSIAKSIDLLVQSVISTFESNDIILKLPDINEISYFNYD